MTIKYSLNDAIEKNLAHWLSTVPLKELEQLILKHKAPQSLISQAKKDIDTIYQYTRTTIIEQLKRDYLTRQNELDFAEEQKDLKADALNKEQKKKLEPLLHSLKIKLQESQHNSSYQHEQLSLLEAQKNKCEQEKNAVEQLVTKLATYEQLDARSKELNVLIKDQDARIATVLQQVLSKQKNHTATHKGLVDELDYKLYNLKTDLTLKTLEARATKEAFNELEKQWVVLHKEQNEWIEMFKKPENSHHKEAWEKIKLAEYSQKINTNELEQQRVAILLKERNASRNDLESSVERLSSKLNEQRKLYTKATKDLAAMETEYPQIKDLPKSINELNERITTLHTQALSYQKKRTAEHKDLVSELSHQLQNIQADYDKSTAEVSSTEYNLKKLKDQHAKLQEEKNALVELLENPINAHQRLAWGNSKLDEYSQQIGTNEAEQRRVVVLLNERTSSHNSKAAQFKNLSLKLNEHKLAYSEATKVLASMEKGNIPIPQFPPVLLEHIKQYSDLSQEQTRVQSELNQVSSFINGQNKEAKQQQASALNQQYVQLSQQITTLKKLIQQQEQQEQQLKQEIYVKENELAHLAQLSEHNATHIHARETRVAAEESNLHVKLSAALYEQYKSDLQAQLAQCANEALSLTEEVSTKLTAKKCIELIRKQGVDDSLKPFLDWDEQRDLLAAKHQKINESLNHTIQNLPQSMEQDAAKQEKDIDSQYKELEEVVAANLNQLKPLVQQIQLLQDSLDRDRARLNQEEGNSIAEQAHYAQLLQENKKLHDSKLHQQTQYEAHQNLIKKTRIITTGIIAPTVILLSLATLTPIAPILFISAGIALLAQAIVLIATVLIERNLKNKNQAFEASHKEKLEANEQALQNSKETLDISPAVSTLRARVNETTAELSDKKGQLKEKQDKILNDAQSIAEKRCMFFAKQHEYELKAKTLDFNEKLKEKQTVEEEIQQHNKTMPG